MVLNMIKLVVGVDEVAELADWISRQGNRSVVHTRQTPKRAEELLAGGSIYRVIKGQILVRQPILGIETLGVKGMTRCEIELDPRLTLTTPQPRRAFQGWRYFSEADAPPDLDIEGKGAMPADLAAQLRTLGAW